MLASRSAFALLLLLAPLTLLGLRPAEPTANAARPAETKVAAALPQTTPPPPLEARPAEPAGDPRTPLVVVISIDQFAYRYIPELKHGFSPDGFFRRIDREGASYPNCHHRHAFTVTAPGHSVQLTGTYPASNGIIGNEWYDTKSKKLVYCVEDDAYPLVGRPPDVAAGGTTASGAKKPGGVSAKRLLVPTVGEELQKQRPGAKLCGVALKDRTAALMCGHKADAVLWFDETVGKWVTSTYYAKQLPDYVTAYNDQGKINQFSGQDWRLSKPLDQYRLKYPDDADFEGTAYGLGRSFPHAIAREGKNYYLQVCQTPYGNDLTLDMVREVISHEGLGKDDTPDLLCVNLSSTDFCGHQFGPDSLEVEDMYYRLDQQLADFTAKLDELVGKDRWTLLITADHGVCPIAEYRKHQGLPGSRNGLGSPESVRAQLNKFLAQRFGPAKTTQGPIMAMDSGQLFLNDAEPLVRDRRREVEDLLVGFLAKHEGIDTIFTKRQLLAGENPTKSKLFDAFRRTCHPQLSGDILWCLKPYFYQSTTPATHGSPWPYDTNVPLLLLGRGVTPGVYPRQTSPAAVAATAARLLGVKPPPTCIERGADEAVAP